MIEKILNILETTTYDFRVHAPETDTLQHLFPEWIKYYQLKYAISKVIQPKSILETGVRYGYSAITFLEASPEASFTGIDIDSEEYGGTKGAIEWAKKITEEYKADFIIADTTLMKSFPGEFYDLIHVDAQQDGDGTYGDLEKALEKGRYILVDGYFWSRQNMLSSTYFIDKYKDFIEYALVIPGYAGELLIKTKPNAKNMFTLHTKAYETLVDSYDSNYYLNDCGGYDTFIKSNGKEITDHRLLAALYLARPNKSKAILDVGSGRGELSYALSKFASHVTGLDYSKDAITIAQQTFQNIDNLEFIQADILKFNTDMKYDVVLATDVVEHIEEDMLHKMYEKITTLLGKNGVFIIHTAPNKLNYMYEYGRRYKVAKEIGTYIPKSPRSYYEDMMHINEQTPANLNRGLKKYFKNIFVWTTSAPDHLGDFDSPPDRNTLKIHDSIFAICSNDELEREDIKALLTQKPLHPDTLNVAITVLGKIKQTTVNEHFKILINIQNKSDEDFTSLLPDPVQVSYHWTSIKNSSDTIFEGSRTPLNLPLTKNNNVDIEMSVIAPALPGTYTLEITMVQENLFWFETIVPDLPIKLTIAVK